MEGNGITRKRTLLCVKIVKNAWTEYEKEDRTKGKAIVLNIKMQHGQIRLVQVGHHA